LSVCLDGRIATVRSPGINYSLQTCVCVLCFVFVFPIFVSVMLDIESYC